MSQDVAPEVTPEEAAVESPEPQPEPVGPEHIKDARPEPVPLLGWERLILHPVLMEPVSHFLLVTKLRDRLRCPECKAVGTWKPHGGWWDRFRYGDRPVRRWLCKSCGFYIGPEGHLYCHVNLELNVWALPDTPGEGDTPKNILKRAKVWPWAG